MFLRNYSKSGFCFSIRQRVALLIAATLCIFVCSTSASGATLTWSPKMIRLSNGTYTLDTVTIVGSKINWGNGQFDGSFSSVVPDVGVNPGLQQLYLAKLSAIALAGRMASVCTNPLVSANARSTSSAADSTSRWIAAQELFNTTYNTNPSALSLWLGNGAPISIIIDAKAYTGYKVYYNDGYSEVWAVNPGHATTVFKLFDNPAPDSLLPPSISTNNPNICK